MAPYGTPFPQVGDSADEVQWWLVPTPRSAIARMSADENKPPKPTEQKFALGAVVITANAQSQLDEISVFACLYRHANGDWGDLDAEDKKTNQRALMHGGRLFSAYHTPSGVKFYIITEWDRSLTTILLPEDY
jgi:hypothetical protein